MELEYWQPLLVGWGVGMAMGFILAMISVCCYKQARAEVEQNEREQEEIQQPEQSSSEAEVLIKQSTEGSTFPRPKKFKYSLVKLFN
jgi:hypothetical protein